MKDVLESELEKEKVDRTETIESLQSQVLKLTASLDSQVDERIRMKREFDVQMIGVRKERQAAKKRSAKKTRNISDNEGSNESSVFALNRGTQVKFETEDRKT